MSIEVSDEITTAPPGFLVSAPAIIADLRRSHGLQRGMLIGLVLAYSHLHRDFRLSSPYMGCPRRRRRLVRNPAATERRNIGAPPFPASTFSPASSGNRTALAVMVRGDCLLAYRYRSGVVSVYWRLA